MGAMMQINAFQKPVKSGDNTNFAIKFTSMKELPNMFEEKRGPTIGRT
jgi:hypothetical protein